MSDTIMAADTQHVTASNATQKKRDSEGMLFVKVLSRTGKRSSLLIPRELVEVREHEMLLAAKQFQIGPDRWNGSLLFRKTINGSNALTLDPESEMARNNFSQSLTWDPWMSQLIEVYYKSGQLKVPHQSRGFELLLALEYFGILYQPDQLIFPSLESYQNVRQWSLYYTRRAKLAQFVANTVTAASMLLKYQFVVAPPKEAKGVWRELDHERLTPLEGELVDTFFQHHAEMRDDFCSYLEKILANVQVAFIVKNVNVHFPDNTSQQQECYLLVIDNLALSKPKTPKRGKSDLSAPVDELAEDDMQKGVLENLLQDIEERNKSTDSPRNAIEDIYRQLEEENDEKIAATAKPQYQGWDDAPVHEAPIPFLEAKENRSFASALTGPFVLDDDGELRDIHADDERAEALRQEWIQGSLLNRDISARVRDLLAAEEARQQRQEIEEMISKQEEIIKEKYERTEKSGTSLNWEWLDKICHDMDCSAVLGSTKNCRGFTSCHANSCNDQTSHVASFVEKSKRVDNTLEHQDNVKNSFQSSSKQHAENPSQNMENGTEQPQDSTTALVKERLALYKGTIERHIESVKERENLLNTGRDFGCVISGQETCVSSVDPPESPEKIKRSFRQQVTEEQKNVVVPREPVQGVPSDGDKKRKGRTKRLLNLFARR